MWTTGVPWVLTHCHILAVMVLKCIEMMQNEFDHHEIAAWFRGASGHMGLSENVVYPIVPNGFADHYPY